MISISNKPTYFRACSAKAKLRTSSKQLVSNLVDHFVVTEGPSFEDHLETVYYTKAVLKKFSLIYAMFATYSKQQANQGKKDFFA